MMFIQGDRVDSTASGRSLTERFKNLRTKKKVKEFIVKRRGYKRPDFNRIILDLSRLGWTHEKIAFVLPVSGASTVYPNGRAVVYQTMKMVKHLLNCGELKRVLAVNPVKVNGEHINIRLGS